MAAFADQAAYQTAITSLVDTLEAVTGRPFEVRVARDLLGALERKVFDATGWEAVDEVAA